MINPYRITQLNNRYYDYENGSFQENLDTRNLEENTEEGVNISINENAKKQFSIAIFLTNELNIVVGDSQVGSTTWLGVSQKGDLETYLNGKGDSMPIKFVTPYGATYDVVPIGPVQFSQRLDNSQNSGMEFRVSMTLKEV